MHLITRKRLHDSSRKYPLAKANIEFWTMIAHRANWRNFVETRKSFKHADQVTVKSGRTVTVFNVSRSFRLITAIHYNRKKIFILRFLTHEEYDRGQWKETL